MGCIQSYFKRAHNAGLSPSSTQDSNNSKTGAQDGGSTVEKDKLSADCASTGKLSADFTSTGDRAPEEPQSNDTSYGVEATAVRTLAASTGTVAILGTTAKTPQSRRESRVSNIETNDEGNNRVAETNADSIDVEIKDDKPDTKKEVPSSVMKEVTEIKTSSLVNKLEEVASAVDKIESVLHTGKTTVNKVETVVSSTTRTESSVTTKEEKVVVVDVESTKVVEDVPTKEVNVVEKDSTKQTTTALVEDVKLDADSSSVAESPLEDAGFSENNFASEGEENEDDRPTTVLEIEKAQSGAEMRSSLSENSENEDTKGMDDEISSEQLKTNSLSDTTLSESYNAGLDSVKQSDNEGATPVVENAEDKGESEDKNGVVGDDLKRNGEPELEGKPVVEEVAVLKKEVSKTESVAPVADSKKEVEEEPIIKTVATKVESAPSNRNSGVDQVLSTVDLKEVANKVENGLMNGVAENGEVDKNGVIDDKMSAAATTIQATFRGYQTRQQNKDKVSENLESNSLPQDIASNNVEVKVMQLSEIVDEETEKKLESIIASKEGLIEKVDDKLDAAATAIQATFRGYQTRQNIKKDDNKTDGKEGEEVVDKTIKVDEVESKKVEEVSNEVVGEDLVVGTKSDGVSQGKVESADKTKPNDASHKVEELVEKTVASRIEESVESKSSREEKSIDKTEANKGEESVDNTKSSKEEKSIDKTEANKVEESVDKTKSSKEEKTVEKPETNKVEESVDKTKSGKEEKSVDKMGTNEEGKLVGKTIPDVAISNNVEETQPEVASNIQDVKPVTQNQSVIEAQVEKVPESEEPAKYVSPKVATVVKESQESSDGSSFDSVQNGSLDPVTCVRIQDKKSGVLEKDGSTDKVGVEVKGAENSSMQDESREDEEMNESLPATTIQANFRGYQARQNLQKKEEEEKEVIKNDEEGGKEVIKSKEVGEEEDDKVLTAATKIQAGFRGYQTRKKLMEDEDDTVVIEALTSRTPELVESVREEVDEICKRAVETTENLISQGLHKFHKSRSVEEEEEGGQENGGGRDEGQENGEIVDESDVVDVAKQTIDAVLEKAEKIADEKLNSAATTIQASFRGFQARQNLEKNTDVDGLPDFPPSTEDEDYTPVPDDDDLPLPDLEALESSYSDELATEPLMPPPPLAATNPPTTPLQNLIIPETEEVSEASTEVGTIEEDLKSLQRPQECDELDRLERERDSTDGESSLSSAATKIQAGVRGYLTRKHINPNQAGTTSTSGPSAALSSDRSLGDFSLSREEEDGPVRSMISTEEETEIGRHGATSSPPQAKRGAMKKRMSLDSRIAGGQTPVNFSRTSRAMSVSAVREDANNDEVWQILQTELSSAATLIQSNFRGYQARKQLRRGDAVQMPTTSCSSTPGSNSQDSSRIGGHITERSSGEYHDMIALTPPNIPNIGEEEEEGKKTTSTTEKSRSSLSRDEDRMVKRRQDEGAQKEEATEEEEAAAKIQAGFRGYKVRRNMNAQDVAATSAAPKSCATSNSDAASNNNHSSAEIEAATKIQAGFRGFKTRQELKSSTKTATATDSK